MTKVFEGTAYVYGFGDDDMHVGKRGAFLTLLAGLLVLSYWIWSAIDLMHAPPTQSDKMAELQDGISPFIRINLFDPLETIVVLETRVEDYSNNEGHGLDSTRTTKSFSFLSGQIDTKTTLFLNIAEDSDQWNNARNILFPEAEGSPYCCPACNSTATPCLPNSVWFKTQPITSCRSAQALHTTCSWHRLLFLGRQDLVKRSAKNGPDPRLEILFRIYGRVYDPHLSKIQEPLYRTKLNISNTAYIVGQRDFYTAMVGERYKQVALATLSV